MDTRTLALSAAVVLTGLGLLLTFSEIFRPPPAPPTAVLATARGQIAPYTFVTQDMVAVGDTVPAGLAKQRGAWTVNDAVGKMSTALIAPGDTLTTGNVLPVEMMRYVEDMGLEIVSFQAAIDKAVAGRIRSGSLINLYGYGRDALNQPVTKLVQGRMWVVAVTAAGAALASATLVPDSVTGELDTRDSERRPGATLTVAVAPSISYKVIDPGPECLGHAGGQQPGDAARSHRRSHAGTDPRSHADSDRHHSDARANAARFGWGLGPGRLAAHPTSTPRAPLPVARTDKPRGALTSPKGVTFRGRRRL
jgi:hypothetical protein